MALRVTRRNATGTETPEAPIYDRKKNTIIVLSSIAVVLLSLFLIGKLAK